MRSLPLADRQHSRSTELRAAVTPEAAAAHNRAERAADSGKRRGPASQSQTVSDRRRSKGEVADWPTASTLTKHATTATASLQNRRADRADGSRRR